MSKKIKDLNETLSKHQANILDRIENYRKQIKTISERELNKSLVPVHEHKPGSVVGAGIEDVPHGKINPKGIDKSMAKAVKCMKCGDMHEPIKKCGPVNKAELINELGEQSSNSVVTPFKDGVNAPKISAKGSGGVTLPGSKLKKALTAGVPSGPASTKVNDLGKALDTSKPAQSPGPSDSAPDKDVCESCGKPSVSGLCDKCHDKLGKEEVKADGKYNAARAADNDHKNQSLTSTPNKGHPDDKPKWGKFTPGNKQTQEKLDSETKKAEPPMAKPPSGKNMNTHVPTSKPGSMAKGVDKVIVHNEKPKPPPKDADFKAKKEGTKAVYETKKSAVPMEKGLFADAAKQADPVSASTPKLATPKVKLPGAGAQAARATNFSSALAGDFQPKGPINSGLELDTKPKAPLGLASPKAAGVAPKAPTVKPGIFGKLFSKK